MSKKMRIMVTIGLGVLIDLLVSLVMNLITEGMYTEILYSYPIAAIVVVVLIYGGTWRYVKNL